jgi:hypothetical protein
MDLAPYVALIPYENRLQRARELHRPPRRIPLRPGRPPAVRRRRLGGDVDPLRSRPRGRRLGEGDVLGHLATGDTEGALFGPGLINPTTAEIHLVVRDHGPKQDPSQEIHSFGACNPTCTDIQFSPLAQ